MSLVRTELMCPDLWDGVMKVDLPILAVGTSVLMRFTIPTKGRIDGLFRVTGRLDVYDSEKSGYTQRLKVEPKEGG